MEPLNGNHRVKKQNDILYSQSVITFLFPLLAAPAICYILWDISQRRTLIIWTATVIIYSLLRFLIIWQYRRNRPGPDDAGSWHDLFTGSVFISGIIWGTAPIILVPHEAARIIEFTLYNGLTLLIICGLVAGAVVAYSISKWVLFFYSFPALLPPAFYLISLGDKYNSTLGGFVVLYFIFITASSFRLNRQLMSSMENEHKMQELRQQYEELKSHYNQLKQYVSSRR